MMCCGLSSGAPRHNAYPLSQTPAERVPELRVCYISHSHGRPALLYGLPAVRRQTLPHYNRIVCGTFATLAVGSQCVTCMPAGPTERGCIMPRLGAASLKQVVQEVDQDASAFRQAYQRVEAGEVAYERQVVHVHKRNRRK